jgi:ABC-2 type transport system permease protein
MISIYKVSTVLKRECLGAFRSRFYLSLAATLLIVSGFFFFSLLGQFNSVLEQTLLRSGQKEANIHELLILPWARTLEVILLFLVPLAVSRGAVQDLQLGITNILYSSTIKNSELAFGKLFGGLLSNSFLILLVALFPLLLVTTTPVEIAPLLTTLVGLLLTGMMFLSITYAAACWAKDQTTAGILAFIAVVLIYIADFPADGLPKGTVRDLLLLLPPRIHAENLYRGVLQSSDLFYFFGIIFISTFILLLSLKFRRWTV